MKHFLTSALILLFSLSISAQSTYFPPSGIWESKPAAQMGFVADSLTSAVAFAEANEYSGSKDLRIAILEGFRREPYHKILGPTKKRGGPAGMIIKDGYVVAQWGDINRVEMTFSVTKSYLSTVAGLAVDEGLIRSVDDKVVDYVWDGTFEGEHNAKVSWDHLLTQSSDWSGELHGVRDWADRPPREGGIDEWKARELHEPGTKYEYNDARVNVLAYSLLNVWRKPLPQVLKDKIMDPIGASTTWRWYGYENAWETIDGIKMQSVTGGGHSGGGVFISTMDHARFGYLFLNDGKWSDKQLISTDWVKSVQKSSTANESYGYMWWLNKGGRTMAGVPDHVFYGAGFGGNYVVVDQKNNMVVVTRWLEPSKLGDFLAKVYKSMPMD